MGLLSYVGAAFMLIGGATLLGEIPRFSGDSLPVPPQQSEPWTPSDAGLERWVDAARALFTQGLADPRGCEYREIEVLGGEAHGWVLPRDPKAQQDFAVCWNGLVYPVWKVGAPADYRVDALEPHPHDAFNTSEGAAVRGRMQDQPGARGPTRNRLPLKICLLLRLGEEALAREVALAQLRADEDGRLPTARKEATPGRRADPPLHEEEDPYLDWAQQWCWSLWNRALEAHMRSDDGLALASLRQLQPIADAVSAEAARRGFKGHRYGDTLLGKHVERYLDWLSDPLASLLADQERRAKLPKRALGFELGSFPPPSVSIAELIEDLQEVSVIQAGQPGGLEPYTFDPIVQALVKCGEAAVIPLLEAWEKDGERLTRSVSCHRDFFPERYLHPVSQPIAAALAAIMEVTVDDFRALAGGRTPAAVRAYWEKMKGTTPAERWYLTMADETAGKKAWQHAAEEIVRPANVRSLGNGWSNETPLKPGESAGLSGEPLRAKSGPTLTELWVARAAQMRPSDEQIRMNIFSLMDSCNFVANLARWEPAAAVQEAALHMDLLRHHFQHNWGLIGSGGNLLDFLRRFATLRADHGDAAGLEDYCAWLATSSDRSDHDVFHPSHWSGGQSHDRMLLFEPLWRNAGNPTVRAAVFVIFAGPHPPVAPLLEKRYDAKGLLAELVKTPMLRFAEVREQVIAALADSAKMDRANLERAAAGPPRVCDFYAAQLAEWKGMPAIDLHWPAERRDAAVAECTRLLRDPGALFEREPAKKSP